MPLKIVKRPGTDTLYVRGTVRGQSVFESTGTADAKRADAYRAKREAELWDRSVYGARAVVTFSHAVESYLSEKTHTPTTLRNVGKLLTHFRTIPLNRITQEAVDGAYRAILTEGISASPATKIRAVLTPLRAILTHAAHRGWCERPTFPTPKVTKPRTTFLRPAEADSLIMAAAPHLRPLLTFLIGTGARMSEALELEWRHVDLHGARAVVWQKQDTERIIELCPRVLAALSALPHREGRVFRPVRARRPPGAESGKTEGAGYASTNRSGGNQIRSGWRVACRKAGLPGEWHEWVPRGAQKQTRVWNPEITPHDLRHTWATWHYCLHRDLLRLRDDGGWTTLVMVTRYAKRMPEIYQDEIRAWFAGGPVQTAKRA
ncbi:tyrosine-type recombinase/integrase [Granulibacter bethesdensis]|uniref:tyrosine-type recombinase/integrase n=1 Tax=Granulibacter bethesdensis TaxID=364410 RepID=UPI0003F21948|nr:tyrosine-type recombinase/integrase [Granulibacter bethesdensis]AHJ69369.1 Phage integrase family protein [Granulibacter bethesdensis]